MMKKTGMYSVLLTGLLWSAPLWAAGEEGQSSMLDFFWKVVNTVILLAILYYFARKPISSALGKSAEEAKATIEEARQAELRIEEELTKAREKLEKVEHEATEMIAKAKVTAEAERQRILEEGEAEVKRITDYARFTIEQEFKKAEYDLRRWVAGVTIDLAEEKLQQRVNADQQKKTDSRFCRQIAEWRKPMSQMVIARRYASALSNLAQKENSLEQVGAELKDFSDTLHESVELQEGLSNNKVPMAVRNNILTDVLTSMKLSPLVSTFLRYLLSKRRLSLVHDIARAFALLTQEAMGILPAEVTVAKEPRSKESKDLLQKLQEQLSASTGKTVQIHVSVDPSIIGGIVTRIGSMVIDGSIRNQLVQVRESIIRG
jgi:F-type H+-transporting ATPase subunit delta